MANWFVKIWNALVSGEYANQRSNEIYLADSVDSYDLERRMRELDQRPRFG